MNHTEPDMIPKAKTNENEMQEYHDHEYSFESGADLFIVAILFWVLLLGTLFLYLVIDFFFIGNVITRAIVLTVLLVSIGVWIRSRLRAILG